MFSNQKPAEIIGITATKEDNFPQWHQEVVGKAGMVEYYTEIAGLFVLRPLTMFIWSELRKWFQGHLDKMDISETAFPLFLSAKSLAKEKDHIEGFAPELAWVTKTQVSKCCLRTNAKISQRRKEPGSSRSYSSHL
ncbi:hypothetical protein LB505_014420 [Fusarium chuoi]|nr:hypothetical protein LB505_014420 [Fusarium chuoi]